MNLKEQIDLDLTRALKDRNELSVSVLRMLKSAIKNLEIDKKEELDGEAVLSVIEKQAKQRKEAIEQYEKAGRPELKEKEESELKILEAYLPEKMGEDEVRTKVAEILDNLSEDDKKNFGKVMGASMAELRGKADPSLISSVIKDILGG